MCFMREEIQHASDKDAARTKYERRMFSLLKHLDVTITLSENNHRRVRNTAANFQCKKVQTEIWKCVHCGCAGK